MAEVGGTPFLDILVRRLADEGLRDLVLCVGHQADVIESYFGDGSGHGLEIRYSRERSLLGTAGAIANARNLIRTEPFVVMNGDSSCRVVLRDFFERHDRSGAVATMALVSVADRRRYGAVTLDVDMRITAFREKGQDEGPGYINGGVYAFQKSIFDYIPEAGPSSMEKDVFPRLCNGALRGVCVTGDFIDIGTPDDLRQAQSMLRKPGDVSC